MSAVTKLNDRTYRWGPLVGAVTGETLRLSGRNHLTISIHGTFGANVRVEGSYDGTNWLILRDMGSHTAINPSTASSFEAVTAYPFIRPVSGTGVTSVTVAIVVAPAR
jgi:hypothetical protein